MEKDITRNLEWIKSGHNKISKAICILESAQELDLEFAFNNVDWNDEIRDYVDKALKYLAYVDAELHLWDEDFDPQKPLD